MRSFARELGVKPADLLEDDDNPDRLSDEERELLARFRAASAAKRHDLERIAAAILPLPDETEAGNGNATAA